MLQKAIGNTNKHLAAYIGDDFLPAVSVFCKDSENRNKSKTLSEKKTCFLQHADEQSQDILTLLIICGARGTSFRPYRMF